VDFSIVDIFAAVLATWRITSAINREKIGALIRSRLAGETPDGVIPNQYTYSDTFLSSLITCFMCLSFWVAVFCTALLVVFPILLYPFAISALVIYLEKVY